MTTKAGLRDCVTNRMAAQSKNLEMNCSWDKNLSAFILITNNREAVGSKEGSSKAQMRRTNTGLKRKSDLKKVPFSLCLIQYYRRVFVSQMQLSQTFLKHASPLCLINIKHLIES